jgi:hypothetical protein
MMVVAKQPGVDVALAQGFLDGCEVHGQRVILHDRVRRRVFRHVATQTVIKNTVDANANARLWQPHPE